MRLLIRLHIILLILLVVVLLLILGWDMSLRGGPTDALLVLGVLLSGALPALLYYRQLSQGMRIYSMCLLLYSVLCLLAWITEQALLVLIALPLMLTLTGLTQKTISPGEGYSIREASCVFKSGHYHLLQELGPLERFVAEIDDWYWTENGCKPGPVLNVQRKGNEFHVKLQQCKGDTVVVVFGR